MKSLTTHVFDPKTCRKQWLEFDALLKSKAVLSEAKDILPFFKTRHDLSILLGWYIPKLQEADKLAHEYPIYGDFRADLVIGNSTNHNYLLVEFEDGTPHSIFAKIKGRASTVWAPRYECAF